MIDRFHPEIHKRNQIVQLLLREGLELKRSADTGNIDFARPAAPLVDLINGTLIMPPLDAHRERALLLSQILTSHNGDYGALVRVMPTISVLADDLWYALVTNRL